MCNLRDAIENIIWDKMATDECGEFYSDDPARDATDAILAALTPPPMEWYINYDHWEATTPHGTYEVGDGGTNSAWVKFPDGSNMWVKPFEMGKRLCDMDNAVSVLGVKEKADG